MKICPKCGAANADSDAVCKECFCSLHAADKQPETAEQFFEREEKKEKRIKWIHLSMIPLYYCVYLPFYILCLIRGSDMALFLSIALVLPFLYYFFMFHEEAAFRLEHLFDFCVENPEDMRPSDWHYISCHITAYVFLLLGIFFVISTYIGFF